MSEGLGSCFFALIVIVLLSFLEAWVLMLLWNWIAPIFWLSAPILTFWQAYGAMVLIQIIAGLFKNLFK
jgi:hypothetical protein